MLTRGTLDPAFALKSSSAVGHGVLPPSENRYEDLSHKNVHTIPGTPSPVPDTRHLRLVEKMIMAPDDELVKGVDMSPDGKYRMLSLDTGQAGTFVYGDIPSGAADKSSETGSENVQHLSSYGQDDQFIGTKGCASCTGMYIEIKANRLFCAHINAWFTDEESAYPIEEGSFEHLDIRKNVASALARHAAANGWEPESAKPETLLLSCPAPRVTAYAVQDAVKDFRGLNYRPCSQKSHGFIVLPGSRTNNNNPKHMPKHRWLTCTPGVHKGDEFPWFHDVPVQFEEVPYLDRKGRAAPRDWNYTCGTDWCEFDPAESDASQTEIETI